MISTLKCFERSGDNNIMSVEFKQNLHLSLVILIICQFPQLVITSMTESDVFGSNTAHRFMSSSELQRIFQVNDHNDVPEYEIVKIQSARRHQRLADGVDIHRVSLQTQSHRVQLELARSQHLIPQDKTVETWFADAHGNNGTIYTVTPKDEEDIGDVYQDENNQAALLLYKDKEDDTLLMDGTIGDDLVIKPISAETRRILSQKSKEDSQRKSLSSETTDKTKNSRRDLPSLLGELINAKKALEEDSQKVTDDDDDYAFLNEDENFEDEDVMGKSKRIQRRKRNDDIVMEEEIRSDLHIIYRRKDSDKAVHSSDYNYMEADTFPGSNKNAHSRPKRQAPYIIFPEILCIVDYDGYRLHGKDNIAIKRYVISFWNGIDLRYKLLKGPSVKISIAGIIISRGRDATPYLERNRVGRDAIDSASALTDMGKYLFLERRLPVYDIAVAITKLDMCRRKSRLGECNRGTAGFAYVGGACVVNKRLEKVNSVAIVEDTGGFSGIIVAAHELGHLLGAVHDGSPPPSYLGGPGARKCRWEDGFIMSDLRHTSKGFRWSHCTVNQFHHFLNGETATCMYNSPHEEESLPRVLPGKLLTLDAQCRKDRGTSACFKDDRVCAQLFCFDAGSGYCVSYRPAAEGSRCGDNYMCLNGKCVPEHENEIDYGGDESSLVRRSGLEEQEYKDVDESGEGYRLSNQAFPTSATSTPPSNGASTTNLTTVTTVSTFTVTTTSSTATTLIPNITRKPWWKRNKLSNSTAVEAKNTTEITSVKNSKFSSSNITNSNVSSKFSIKTTTPFSLAVPSSSPESLTADIVSNPSNKNSFPNMTSSNDVSEICIDRISNIAGSLSCDSFLRSFAYQYCRHKYIQRNCCVSRQIHCTKSKVRTRRRK